MSYKLCTKCGKYHYHQKESLNIETSNQLNPSSSIKPKYLISDSLVANTQYLLSNDNLIDIYIHKKGGEVLVQQGIPSSTQIIQSLEINDSDLTYFQSIVNDLDEKIDLDFNFINSSSQSDISVYYDSEIELGNSGTILGLASAKAQSNQGWELFINRPELNNIKYRRYALIHELGHSLGLEHPFSSSDGDVWKGITDPYKSSYPEDTVMAYRTPLNGPSNWPQEYSSNDINALMYIWNEESSNNYYFAETDSANSIVLNWFASSIPDKSEYKDLSGQILNITTNTWTEKIKINRIGNASNEGGLLQGRQNPAAYNRNISGKQGSILDGSLGKDTLRGLGGWDIIDGGGNDDLIHGGNGRDIIDGGVGADELHGDFGWNTFKSQEDGWRDLIAIKSDQYLSNWWFGKSGNSSKGERADFIEGLDANDEIKIIGASSSDLTFAGNVTHRGVTGIGIYAKGTLEAVFTGKNLSVSQIQSITTGDASKLAMSNGIWSYRSTNQVPNLLP